MLSGPAPLTGAGNAADGMMMTRGDTPASPQGDILASATLAELYRRQGHPEMAERLLAGLDPSAAEAPSPAASSPRDRRIRGLRALLAQVRDRQRPAKGDPR